MKGEPSEVTSVEKSPSPASRDSDLTSTQHNMRDEAVVPVCVFTSLACIFVVLRIYARLFLVGGLQTDDYLIVASFVSNTRFLVCLGR